MYHRTHQQEISSLRVSAFPLMNPHILYAFPWSTWNLLMNSLYMLNCDKDASKILLQPKCSFARSWATNGCICTTARLPIYSAFLNYSLSYHKSRRMKSSIAFHFLRVDLQVFNVHIGDQLQSFCPQSQCWRKTVYLTILKYLQHDNAMWTLFHAFQIWFSTVQMNN